MIPHTQLPTQFFLLFVTMASFWSLDMVAHDRDNPTDPTICRHSDQAMVQIIIGLGESYYFTDILVRGGKDEKEVRDLLFNATLTFTQCLNPTMTEARYQEYLDNNLATVCASILNEPRDLYKYFLQTITRLRKLNRVGIEGYEPITLEERQEVINEFMEMEESIDPMDFLPIVEAVYQSLNQ